jgi:hypothetical protein
MHQGIAPRNLLVNAAGNLKLFDFDRVAKINSRYLEDCAKDTRNDINRVIFTIYELFTYDEQYRIIHWEEQDVSQVENLAGWPAQRLPEDRVDVTTCRDFLARWVADRRTKRTIHDHPEAKEPLDWPAIPEVEPCKYLAGFKADGQAYWDVEIPDHTRYLALQDGRHVVSWERPPQNVDGLPEARHREGQRFQDTVPSGSISE